MAVYNVFVPGYNGAPINIKTVTGGLTTERPVSGSMFYGVNSSTATGAVAVIQAAIGSNHSEAASAFLQSNDNRPTER